jgi:thiol-disulfide isomerase/thioredoxin
MIKLLARTFLLLSIAIGTALAANMPFQQAKFDQLLKDGKPVVLHIHADWCPVCRAQDAVLEDLLPLEEFKSLTVLRADFDTEKTLLRKYKVRNQSTFIMFKNGKEVARSTGETDSTRISELLKKAL